MTTFDFPGSVIRTARRLGAECKDRQHWLQAHKKLCKYTEDMFDPEWASSAEYAALHGFPIPREWLAERYRKTEKTP